MNTNVTTGQLMSESACKISTLNPPTCIQTPTAQPFFVHVEHLLFGKERRAAEEKVWGLCCDSTDGRGNGRKNHGSL